MKNNKSFDLSIYRLLQEYPLYDYRIPGAGRYRLPVLLIGSGKNLNTLRNKILSNGQLLKTDLEVTVVTEDRAAALEDLKNHAPDLKRFIDIEGIAGTVEMPCGKLRYVQESGIRKNLSTIISRYADTRYVLISLDTTDPAPSTIIPASGQLIAWVAEDTIQVCGVKDQVFLPTRDDHAMAQILDIAYRLHYAYEKGNDPYITNREIREHFNELYNYRSNIECALHVRSKLKSIDIDPTTLNSAAEEFAKKLEEDARNNGSLLEYLAQLEHRRWCVSKTADGRRCDDKTIELIYGDDGSTTHNISETATWHVALVPYTINEKLRRCLSEQDWLHSDPDSIKDLDELDKQTLRVHRQCARISGQKLLQSRSHLDQILAEVPEGLRTPAALLDEPLKKMMKCEREAVFAFRHHRRNLQEKLSGMESDALSGIKKLLCEETFNKITDAAKALKKITNTDDVLDALTKQLSADEASTVSDHLNDLALFLRIQRKLNLLDRDMGAPIEYLTRKDYKKQNLVLMGSIPFALCRWKATVLVKLMAESVHECVAAAWQLEPGHIIFVDTAENLEELKKLSLKARQIDRFLSRNCNQVASSYHIFVPRNTVCVPDPSKSSSDNAILLEDILTHDPTFFEGGDWHLHSCLNLEAEELRPYFVELMCQHKVTSIDVTGGKPALISLANGFAQNSRTSAFFIRDNRIRNFYGARGMERQALDKGLTVQQLFDPTDIELSKREDDTISHTFYQKYQELWEIAHKEASEWHNFSRCYGHVYKNKIKTHDPDEPLRIPYKDLHVFISKSYPKDPTKFDSILGSLQAKGLLTCDSAQTYYQAVCDEVVDCLQNSGKILEYYICCTAKTSHCFDDVAMSWTFRHNNLVGAAKNEIDVICTGQNANLFISAKNVSQKTLDSSKTRNYIYYEISWLADRFGGPSCRVILAAPNLAQFEDGGRSKIVTQAMNRGVYLLGDRCFEDDHLLQVLTNIKDGKEDWCEFMLNPSTPVCV